VKVSVARVFLQSNPGTLFWKKVMATEYQAAAAVRWPHYTITGDGPNALICPASYSITLFGWWFEAACELMKDHSNWRCKNSHSLAELKPMPQRTPVSRAFAERIEQD
jgi:hypothetical protein